MWSKPMGHSSPILHGLPATLTLGDQCYELWVPHLLTLSQLAPPQPRLLRVTGASSLPPAPVPGWSIHSGLQILQKIPRSPPLDPGCP